MYFLRILRILTIGFLLVEDFPHLDTSPDKHDTSLYENLCDEVMYLVVIVGGLFTGKFKSQNNLFWKSL